MSHGSGDYVIAFSTVRPTRDSIPDVSLCDDSQLSPLFQATVEACEEAIYNSLLKATDTQGYHGTTVEAIPIGTLKDVLKKYGRLK
jgi:D-aminopeptidase